MVATVLVLLSTQPLAAGPLAGNAWLMPVVTLSELCVRPADHGMTWGHAAAVAGDEVLCREVISKLQPSCQPYQLLAVMAVLRQPALSKTVLCMWHP